MKKCVYCDKTNAKITNEHVVNKSFLDRYYKIGQGYAKIYDKTTKNYLTVKDVCSACNNGVLSVLDEYFLRFYEENLPKELIGSSYKIRITYNYEKLSKWLLKTLYNSERKSQYEQIQPKMHRYKNYILGKDKKNQLFRIYIELLRDISLREINTHPSLPIDFNGKFNCFKLGTIILHEQANQIKKDLTKYILSSNFVFHVFLLDPGQHKEKVFMERLKKYIKNSPGSNLMYLNPASDNIELISSKRNVIDIWARTIEGDKSFLERNNKYESL